MNGRNQSQADTIYIHDQRGTVVASSNYQKPRTFVGENFFFVLILFFSAIKGDKTIISPQTSMLGGYFLSSPLYIAATSLGVITVKVSLGKPENKSSPAHDFEIARPRSRIKWCFF
ncbi:hypothetical protein O9993_08990 [Vibrio lentus]|nr:hypothetical protein [Vibrio lentus]